MTFEEFLKEFTNAHNSDAKSYHDFMHRFPACLLWPPYDIETCAIPIDQLKDIYNSIFGPEVGTIHDEVNHPKRYTKGDVECIDAIRNATVGKTGIEAVDVGAVIKYLWRYEEKGGIQDVKKAEWYLKHLIKQLEK